MANTMHVYPSRLVGMRSFGRTVIMVQGYSEPHWDGMALIPTVIKTLAKVDKSTIKVHKTKEAATEAIFNEYFPTK